MTKFQEQDVMSIIASKAQRGSMLHRQQLGVGVDALTGKMKMRMIGWEQI